MVSFNLKLLFTSVPLQNTIDVPLRIFDRKEINTTIASFLKEQLLLCTKFVHFTFEDCVYLQNNEVAMGSPLSPILAGIIMFELETKVVPRISNYIVNRKRFVDD